MKDTYIQIGLIVLIGVTGLISYHQGLHNGKIELCEIQGLKYATTTAGPACVSNTDLELQAQQWDRTPKINNTQQWQIT